MPSVLPDCNASRRGTVPATARRWLATAILLGAPACSDGSGTAGPDPIPPLPQGTIAVTLTPASVTVPPGGTGSVGVSITRGGGFGGAVALTASGVPAGVSLTFGSTTVAAGAVATSISVSVAASTPVATSEISIIGSATGVVSPPSKLTLRVQ